MATLSECLFEVNPFDVSQPLETNKFISLNYTNQDFWSMKTRLVSYINQEFADSFNDFVESSLAIMLIENWAYIADTLSFKIDQIANEIFIDTVTEIDNAFRLADLIGFKPQPPIAARSMWSAVTNTIIGADLIVPAPYDLTIPAADGNINIELFPADSANNPLLDEDIIIPAGSTQNIAIVGLEGQTVEEQFAGTGTQTQIFGLAGTPVLYGSVRVKVDGSAWEQVDYFTDSQKRKEYLVEFDSDYKAYVIFGNNRGGFIPQSGAEIEVIYRTGGGPRGNIVTNVAVVQRVIDIPVFPHNLPVTFTNYTKGEYGYSGDNIDDIRRKLPQWVQTQNRAVTAEDYKTLADQFASPYNGQVGKSVAVLRQYGCAANIIDLYALAREDEDDLAEMSDELKVELQEYLDSKKMMTDEVCIRDGVRLGVDVNVDITVSRTKRKFEQELRERALRRIERFFRLVNWEYGDDLKDTDIIKILSDVQDYQDFTITFITSDPDNSGSTVTARFSEIIRPDEYTISFTYE